jgi:hypothetical protein
MDDIKEGQEAGQVEEVKEGEQEVVEKTVVEENKEEVEKVEPELDPKLFDSDGKSWKSKFKEAERKYNGVLEKVVAQSEQRTNQDQDEEIPATRNGVKKVLSEITREEQIAGQVFDEVYEEIILEKPEFEPYKNELQKMIKSLNDPEAKKNPETIKIIAKGLWGTKNWKAPATVAKPKPRLVAGKQSDVLTPSIKSGAGSSVELTDAEQEYAEHHRFIGTFDNEEIKDMYKKSQSKKK